MVEQNNKDVPLKSYELSTKKRPTLTYRLCDVFGEGLIRISSKLWSTRTRNYQSLVYGLAILAFGIIICLVSFAFVIITLTIDFVVWCTQRIEVEKEVEDDKNNG